MLKSEKQSEEYPLLTVREVAQILGVSVQRVRYEVFRKRIPYIKLGASVRFSRADIERWIKANAVREAEE